MGPVASRTWVNAVQWGSLGFSKKAEAGQGNEAEADLVSRGIDTSGKLGVEAGWVWEMKQRWNVSGEAQWEEELALGGQQRWPGWEAWGLPVSKRNLGLKHLVCVRCELTDRWWEAWNSKYCSWSCGGRSWQLSFLSARPCAEIMQIILS